MIKDIADFFNGEIMTILTGIFAILSFIFTAANFVYLYFTKRKRLTVYFGVMSVSNQMIRYNNKLWNLLKISFRIDNRSQLPISVTQIRICINGQKYNSEPRPYVAETHSYRKGKEILENSVINTTILPICLGSLDSRSGYLAFLIPPDTLSGHETTLNFEICTNRGKAVQRTFSLCEDKNLN